MCAKVNVLSLTWLRSYPPASLTGCFAEESAPEVLGLVVEELEGDLEQEAKLNTIVSAKDREINFTTLNEQI